MPVLINTDNNAAEPRGHIINNNGFVFVAFVN